MYDCTCVYFVKLYMTTSNPLFPALLLVLLCKLMSMYSYIAYQLRKGSWITNAYYFICETDCVSVLFSYLVHNFVSDSFARQPICCVPLTWSRTLDSLSRESSFYDKS